MSATYDIEAILLEGGKFDNYSVPSDKNGHARKRLDHVSKINILVGENNSGKSRFIRNIAATELLKFSPHENFDALDSFKRKISQEIQEVANAYGISELGEGLIAKAKAFDYIHEISEKQDLFHDVEVVFPVIMGTPALTYSRGNSASHGSSYASKPLHEKLKQFESEYEQFRKAIPPSGYTFSKLYIPSLRGLRPINKETDIYCQRTKQDYFQDAFCPDIFTGQDLYTHVENLLLGDLDQREIIANFQDFLSEAFFNKAEVALIPRRGSDVLWVKIGNEDEFPVQQLGDGIQQIIILTFPLFERFDEKMIVFVEEPEMYLHPGFQRVLIKTFLNFANHQFFLTTHSNHFLDLTLDYEHISIYTFNKRLEDTQTKVTHPKFEIVNVSNEDTQPLELLGVKNSSVFLSNCTIWVEGITDRRYLAHYLKMYMDYLESTGITHFFDYKEDLHYSFVEYSGGNITHWSFLGEEDTIQVERLCGKLFLISDKDANKKILRQEKLKEALGERYYCLESREIENLLAPNVIRKVIEQYEGQLLDQFSYEHKSYKNIYLGKFIAGTVLKGQQNRRGQYAEESGTVTKKVDFCDKAISHIKSFNDLTEEAQELTKKVYEFIKANNPA